MLVNVHNEARTPDVLRSPTTCHMDQSLTLLCTVHFVGTSQRPSDEPRQPLFTSQATEQLVPPTTSSLQQRRQLLTARGKKGLGLATVSVQAAAGAAR